MPPPNVKTKRRVLPKVSCTESGIGKVRKDQIIYYKGKVWEILTGLPGIDFKKFIKRPNEAILQLQSAIRFIFGIESEREKRVGDGADQAVLLKIWIRQDRKTSTKLILPVKAQRTTVHVGTLSGTLRVGDKRVKMGQTLRIRNRGHKIAYLPVRGSAFMFALYSIRKDKHFASVLRLFPVDFSQGNGPVFVTPAPPESSSSDSSSSENDSDFDPNCGFGAGPGNDWNGPPVQGEGIALKPCVQERFHNLVQYVRMWITAGGGGNMRLFGNLCSSLTVDSFWCVLNIQLLEACKGHARTYYSQDASLSAKLSMVDYIIWQIRDIAAELQICAHSNAIMGRIQQLLGGALPSCG